MQFIRTQIFTKNKHWYFLLFLSPLPAHTSPIPTLVTAVLYVIGCIEGSIITSGHDNEINVYESAKNNLNKYIKLRGLCGLGLTLTSIALPSAWGISPHFIATFSAANSCGVLSAGVASLGVISSLEHQAYTITHERPSAPDS